MSFYFFHDTRTLFVRLRPCFIFLCPAFPPVGVLPSRVFPMELCAMSLFPAGLAVTGPSIRIGLPVFLLSLPVMLFILLEFLIQRLFFISQYGLQTVLQIPGRILFPIVPQPEAQNLETARHAFAFIDSPEYQNMEKPGGADRQQQLSVVISLCLIPYRDEQHCQENAKQSPRMTRRTIPIIFNITSRI